MKFDDLANQYLEPITESPGAGQNQSDVIIDKYNKYTQAIYNNLHQIKQLIESEGYREAMDYDQENYDGDNNLVGYFGAFIENLAEGFRE